jgi:ribosomal-protein-alanine N-acetyltransferase
MKGPVVGLVIEAATEHVEVLVQGGDFEDVVTLAHEVEEVGHGHTRRLTPLIATALERAGVKPLDLHWIGVDLGPGSFTGVRVGLATAEALALAAGAQLFGASSLASLALASGARGALVVPLVPAGRRDLYAGFFRAGTRGDVTRGEITLLAAPRVGPVPVILAAVAEAFAVAGVKSVRFVGPGALRELEHLERAYPGSTQPEVRFEGLSAIDLAAASLCTFGASAGVPGPHDTPTACYVRPAQAEERVRHAAVAGDPVTLRPMEDRDLARIAEVERDVFSDPWPEPFFRSELAQVGIHARVAEFDGELAGYSMAWLGEGSGHLGNIAVVPGRRRRGIARRLVEDLLEHARAEGADPLSLEVRVSNFAAQGLYRDHGFRLAGLRRGYYRDTGEDALIMEWRASAAEGSRPAKAKTPEARSTLP